MYLCKYKGNTEISGNIKSVPVFPAINALQYSGTDERLTKEDWEGFQQICDDKGDAPDALGFGFAARIVRDALELWPERRLVV